MTDKPKTNQELLEEISTLKRRVQELEKNNIHLHMEITEYKQTAKGLKQNEAVLRSLLEATPAGVGLLYDRIFLNVNKALCMITGYSEQDMLGQTTRMLYPDEEEFSCIGRKMYGQLESEGLGMLEANLQHKDGMIINVLLCMSPFDPQNLSAGGGCHGP